MHVRHKPGDRIEVDWAGDTACIKDNITGEPIPVYIFVAALSCSGYAYASPPLVAQDVFPKTLKIGYRRM